MKIIKKSKNKNNRKETRVRELNNSNSPLQEEGPFCRWGLGIAAQFAAFQQLLVLSD